MASVQAVQAVIRALRPTFRSPCDKVVFAVHAAVSVNGGRLLGVAETADSADPKEESDDADVSLVGWNGIEGGAGLQTYSFLYRLNPADIPSNAAEVSHPRRPPVRLLVRCLPLDKEELLLSFLADPHPEGKEPDTFQLLTSDYCSQEAVASFNYTQLQQLIEKTQSALYNQVVGHSPGQARLSDNKASNGATPSGAGRTVSKAQAERKDSGSQRQDVDGSMEEDENGARSASHGFGQRMPFQDPWEDPLSLGHDDRVPGIAPGLGFPPGHGGGMHMGPAHPAFAGRRGQSGLGPWGGGSGGPGPGIRWDPVAPEGLQGWHPDDYTRGPMSGRGQGLAPPVHPDVMPMGQGRGTDWDAMFG